MIAAWPHAHPWAMFALGMATTAALVAGGVGLLIKSYGKFG